MQFELDPVKSTANKAKHGIDFKEAQKLWLDKKCFTHPGQKHRGRTFRYCGPTESEDLVRRLHRAWSQDLNHYGQESPRQ